FRGSVRGRVVHHGDPKRAPGRRQERVETLLGLRPAVPVEDDDVDRRFPCAQGLVPTGLVHAAGRLRSTSISSKRWVERLPTSATHPAIRASPSRRSVSWVPPNTSCAAEWSEYAIITSLRA